MGTTSSLVVGATSLVVGAMSLLEVGGTSVEVAVKAVSVLKVGGMAVPSIVPVTKTPVIAKEGVMEPACPKYRKKKI